MKSTRILYWVFTSLLALLMLAASVPDVLQLPGAIAIITHLGYPVYLLPFIGTAKILAVAAVVLPGFAGLKEWAYAGIFFDVAGALYSHLSVGDGPAQWMFAFIGLILVSGSYLFFRFEQQKSILKVP
jgi:hypothetical protein